MGLFYYLFYVVLLIIVIYITQSLYYRLCKKTNTWDLSGVVVLVTGGSKGLGKGIAVALGKAGATVYLTGYYTQIFVHISVV